MFFPVKFFFTLISSIIFTLLIPSFTGFFLSKQLRLTQNFYVWYLTGTVSLWALSQIILVPLVMMGSSFYLALFLVTVLYILGGIPGILLYMKRSPSDLDPRTRFLNLWESWSKKQRLSFLITVVLTAVIIISVSIFQKEEYSDVHYLVNAADMIHSGRMYFSNPASGELQAHFSRTCLKDLSSPWSFQYAFLGLVTFSSPLTAAHMILPVQVFILCTCLYRLFAEHYSRNNLDKQNLFFIMMWAIQILGCYSTRCSEASLMTRAWHPAAVLSSAGIPLLIYIYLCFVKEPDKKKYYVILTAVNLVLCCTSRSGIILGILLSLGFGISYSLWKKTPALFMGSLCSVIPNFIYWICNDKIIWSLPDWPSVFEKTVNSFLLYTGDQLMTILAMFSTILLCVFWESRARLLVYPVLVSLGLAFLMMAFNLLPYDMETTDLYWLFPEALIIVTTFFRIISRSSGLRNHLFGYGMLILMLVVTGNNFYAEGDMHLIENVQKMDGHCKEVYDFILDGETTPSCLFCDDFIWASRQYSSKLMLPFIYNEDGSMTFSHAPEQILAEAISRNFPISGFICQYASIARINYIVVKARNHLQYRYLKKYGYYAAARIDDTIIYRHQSPQEAEHRQFIAKQLHLNSDQIHKAIRKIDKERLSIIKEKLRK